MARLLARCEHCPMGTPSKRRRIRWASVASCRINGGYVDRAKVQPAAGRFCTLAALIGSSLAGRAGCCGMGRGPRSASRIKSVSMRPLRVRSSARMSASCVFISWRSVAVSWRALRCICQTPKSTPGDRAGAGEHEGERGGGHALILPCRGAGVVGRLGGGTEAGAAGEVARVAGSKDRAVIGVGARRGVAAGVGAGAVT